ncbi:MAG: AAA family ATPase, partial [Acidimicrobiales bacterium]
GIIFAHTRHATSRAGDPCPHDHVLLANVVEMADETGGWKAANTSLWREHLHAATMAGRVAAAHRAVELGYGIEADPGPSGRLGHWRIAGIPDDILDMHSKRAAEITAAVEVRGDTSYRARGVAARTTRTAKEHRSEGELVGRWRAELAAAGWPPDRLLASVQAASGTRIAGRPSVWEVRRILTDALVGDGDLARRKVFARRHLVVALAPNLYGWDPRALDALVARAVADPAVVPLLGVAGAIEPAYSLASVLAAEGAIADSLEHHLTRTDAPTCGPETAAAAIAQAGAAVGGLSSEQRAAAEAICTSGRGAELVVGVAGAGKTTMLAAVAQAYETSGFEVIGASTAGQAARTLGAAAGLAQSSTLAALAGQLARGERRLGERSVVILDEVGMTDDIDLARLLAHVQVAGAKLIAVGDHRQLSPVGPGGALAAMVARHPDAVHRLNQNRRQADRDERRALDQLRDGDVTAAIAWYGAHDRIRPTPDRREALQAAVDAWSADTAAGADTALLAWRRANVAELNTAARAWMTASGRLTGPELSTPDGAAYRAGDHVVALAPDRHAGLVTSQRATITSVDLANRTLTLTVDEGRLVTLAGDQFGPDRLGYGYATTVHRAQGATVDRAHLFADGGGRELAYVAMSRARLASTAYVVADDLDQAAEDLGRDWNTRRTPVWAIDTGLPDPHQLSREDAARLTTAQRDRVVAVAHARNLTTTRAADGAPRPQPPAELADARAALSQTQRALAHLPAGTGVYRGTVIGEAADEHRWATATVSRFEEAARGAQRSRDRRQAARQLPDATAAAEAAGERLDMLTAPETVRLQQVVAGTESIVARLQADRERNQRRWDRLVDQARPARTAAEQSGRMLGRLRDGLDRPAGRRHDPANGRVDAVAS